MKILVIDDDEQIREMLRIRLEREGFTVHVAVNGREGVQIQQETPVDLVICDLIMPVQEGIETIMQFRDQFPDVGIIAISGGGKIAPESYLSVAGHLGAWRVFRKPVVLKEMVAAICEWGQSRQLL